MKPILFNTAMVKALLDGRKTVTRRIVKAKVLEDYGDYDDHCIATMPRGGDVSCTRTYEKEFYLERAPYAVGDVLYVRETYAVGKIDDCGDEYQEKLYISQCEGENDIIPKEWAIHNHVNIDEVTWKPSIFMPKSAARIFLKVTGVRVERLRDIKPEDVIREGAVDRELYLSYYGARRTQLALERWESLWNSTIKKQDLDEYGWDANPWVFRIEFERCEKPEVVL